MQNMRRAADAEDRTQCREAGLKKRYDLEEGERFLVRDGVCLSPEELLGAIESRETGFSLENSDGRMLAELLRE